MSICTIALYAMDKFSEVHVSLLVPQNKMCKGCHKANRFEEIQKQLSLALEKTNHITEQNEGPRADIISLRDQ